MQFTRWTWALVALAVASPAGAKVYHFDDGVVRVRSGSSSSVPASQPSDRRRVVLTAIQPDTPAQTITYQPTPYQPAPYQPASDSASTAPLLDQAAAQAAGPRPRVRTQLPRLRGAQMANISGQIGRREGWLPFQGRFGSRWKPFGRPEGVWTEWPIAASAILEISTYSCVLPPSTEPFSPNLEGVVIEYGP